MARDNQEQTLRAKLAVSSSVAKDRRIKANEQKQADFKARMKTQSTTKATNIRSKSLSDIELAKRLETQMMDIVKDQFPDEYNLICNTYIYNN